MSSVFVLGNTGETLVFVDEDRRLESGEWVYTIDRMSPTGVAVERYTLTADHRLGARELLREQAAAILAERDKTSGDGRLERLLYTLLCDVAPAASLIEIVELACDDEQGGLSNEHVAGLARELAARLRGEA